MRSRLLIFIILGWRVWLSLITLLAIAFLPFRPTFPYAFEVLPIFGPRFLTTWAHFDGVHYLTIALKGYVGTGLIQAFFPLYPLLIGFFSAGIVNPLITGLLISTMAFALGLWFLYRLVQLDETELIARKTLVLLLLFPTAFFFTAVYNEGLFFLLSVFSFYLARKKLWFWAGVVGALAAATRLIGVFIVFGLLIEYYYYTQKYRLRISQLLALFIPLVGLGAYMAYLGNTFGDPLLFYHVQEGFGAGRESNTLVLLPQVFYRYIKIFMTLQPEWTLWYRTVFEFLAGIFGLTLAIVAFRKTRLSYAVYLSLAYTLPTLTGNFSSLPRYLLPLFPLFIVLAKATGKRGYLATLIIFVILQVVNVLLFTQGIFVS